MDEVKPAQVRRALARAERGAALDLDEATALLAARGEELDRLCAAAARVRDAGLVAAGRPGVGDLLAQGLHPGHPAVPGPVPLLHVRRDAGARRARGAGAVPLPRRDPRDRPRRVPSWAAWRRCSRSATGPRTAGPRREEWLDEQGYDSTLAYVRAMAVRVLEETGLLPHLNPGVMSWEEMNRLKPVSPSMGMMLETTSTRLFTRRARPTSARPTRTRRSGCGCSRTPAGCRSRSPPGCWSGSARRSPSGRRRSSRCARSPGSTAGIQEVIVQNFRAKPDTAMRHADDLGLDEYRAAIAVTRLLLGPKAAGAGAAQPGRPRPSAGRCSTPASTTGAASPR